MVQSFVCFQCIDHRVRTNIGIQLSLYYTTLRLIRRERKRHGRNVGNERLFYLSTLFLFTATVHLAVQGIFGEEMWILNADYPGGNAAYFVDHSSVWYETMDTAVGVLMGLATDGYQVGYHNGSCSAFNVLTFFLIDLSPLDCLGPRYSPHPVPLPTLRCQPGCAVPCACLSAFTNFLPTPHSPRHHVGRHL